MKLENIMIDNDNSRFVYKLDLIELEWEEKYKTAGPDEKENYNFSRFFFIKFFSNDQKVVEEYIVTDTKENEDKIEIVFKRDRLLWTKWEFSRIQSILPLEYDDIRVERNKLLYDIFIENADLKITKATAWEGKDYKWYFSSQYMLSTSDHYFTGVKIKLYDGIKGDEKFLFWDSEIHISGKVQLQDFTENIENMFQDMNLYTWIYNDIHSLYPSVWIQIQYNIYNKKMTFKFDSGEKTFTILVSEGKLERVYKGTYKVLSESVNTSELTKYIK